MSSPTTDGNSASSLLSKVLALGAVVGGMAGAGAGLGVVRFGGPAAAPTPVVQTAAPMPNAGDAAEPAAEASPPAPKVGFRMGSVPPDEPITSIKVTLAVGGDGAELNEPVDLHLGVGFPLRLYPLGTDERAPSFAAFPQKSSLERGTNFVAPGQRAVFEFHAQSGEPGADELRTTPQLLADLKAGDLRQIGFASPARSAWVLDGYEIEVNGKLFAANDSVAHDAAGSRSGLQEAMRKLQPEHEQLAMQAADLAAYVATGLAGDADKEDLKKKQEALAKSAPPINALAARLAGAAPWYEEKNEAFKPAPTAGTPLKNVEITLVAGGGDRPGSRNPVYLWAGGLKYLLTSEADPLADASDPQTFALSEDDLARSPLTKERLATIGIGMLGNDQRFSRTPDRAKLERIVVKGDGETLYDSETKPGDRQTLSGIWLQPPAHRDENDALVVDAATPTEPYLWKSGTTLPAADLAKADTLDETQPEPAPVEPLARLPDGSLPTAGALNVPDAAVPTTGAMSPGATSGTPSDPSSTPGGTSPAGTDTAGGAKPYGTDSYGSTPEGGTPYGSSADGSSPYGNSPYGGTPYGTTTYGNSPYGTSPFSPPARRLGQGLDYLSPLVTPLFFGGGNSYGGPYGNPYGSFGNPYFGGGSPFGGSPYGGPNAFGNTPNLAFVPGTFVPAGVGTPSSGTPTGGAANPANTNNPNPVNPANVAPNPAPAAVPAPTAPSITNVRINLATAVRDGDAAPVSWQVVGDASKVTSYRVDLFGVLPHLAQPLLSQPLTTLTNISPPAVAAAGGAQPMNAVTPAIKAANAKLNGAALTPAQNTYLYVQAKVTALSSGGADLASAFSPLVPLYFADTPPLGFGLSTGNLFPNGLPSPPSYMRIVGGNNQPWQSYDGTRDPKTASSAWLPAADTAAHSAQIFTTLGSVAGATPWKDVVVRPGGNGEVITVLFEGFVPLPNTIAPPGGGNLPAGLRAVAHVGFVDGSATAADVATIQSAASVDFSGPSTLPLKKECFLLTTKQPLTLNRNDAGGPSPMLLLDMPLRFDKMTGPNPTVQSDTSYLDATRYAVTDWNPTVFRNGPQLVVRFGRLRLALPLGNAPPPNSVYVRLTYMIQLKAADLNTAVGIFGVRLVPDASP